MRPVLVVLVFVALLSFGSSAFAENLLKETQVSSAQDLSANFDSEFEDDFASDDNSHLIADPFETWNRGVFWFNDKLYFFLLKPIARTYRIVPRPARNSVKNFFSNLSSPVRIANSLLQFKISDAVRETGRFFINTTVGIGGLFDPADKWGKISKKDEDFGQTLGAYHLGSGPYLVLPFLGPSSLRDTGGLVVDTFLDPLTLYMVRDWNLNEKVGLKAGLAVNALSLDDDSYEKLKRDALDPYLFMRAAYAQYRVAKIAK